MSEHNRKLKGSRKEENPVSAEPKKKRIALPVSNVKQGSLLSFRDMADLKAKYFTFSGTLERKPCAARLVMLLFCQFIMTAILAGRIIEALFVGQLFFTIFFGVLLVALNIPVIWAEFSLGVRRLHDLQKPGLLFIVPFLCYIASFAATAMGYDMVATIVQSVTAVLFLALFTIKGKADVANERRRDR